MMAAPLEDATIPVAPLPQEPVSIRMPLQIIESSNRDSTVDTIHVVGGGNRRPAPVAENPVPQEISRPAETAGTSHSFAKHTMLGFGLPYGVAEDAKTETPIEEGVK